MHQVPRLLPLNPIGRAPRPGTSPGAATTPPAAMHRPIGQTASGLRPAQDAPHRAVGNRNPLIPQQRTQLRLTPRRKTSASAAWPPHTVACPIAAADHAGNGIATQRDLTLARRCRQRYTVARLTPRISAAWAAVGPCTFRSRSNRSSYRKRKITSGSSKTLSASRTDPSSRFEGQKPSARGLPLPIDSQLPENEAPLHVLNVSHVSET